MTAAASDGIPVHGAFGDPWPPSGTHRDGRWAVNDALNAVADTVLFGDRAVRSFVHRPANYDAMIRAAASRRPDAEAVVCGERRVPWRDLDARIESVAHGLMDAGLARGDRLAVMLDNRLEFIVAVLACVRAGGIAIPLGTRLGPMDVAYIVEHARPVLAITAQAWAGRFPARSSIVRRYLVDAETSASAQATANADAHADATASANANANAGMDTATRATVDGIARPPADHFDSLSTAPPQTLPQLSAEDPMMLMYTSGTTGKPKGVVLTHINFVHTVLHYLYALGIDAPQRSLLTIPASHIAGFGPVLSVTLASGGTTVLMRDFDAEQVLATVQRERITYSVLVPAMIQLCAQHPRLPTYDLATWRYGIYGGAIMPPPVIARLAHALPHLRMINAYGATETCAVCTIMPHELTSDFPSSVGLPLQCDDIRVVDPENPSLPAGGSGELLIRGPNVFARYWNDDAATAAAFEDGYWRSGDIGAIDDAGLVYVQDRVKDMINRGGYKVFSAEVEAALTAHAGVADCAVVGVPHPVLGEKTFAFVQPRTADVTAEVLRDFLAARIADYKVPDFWEVGSAPIPRNQNGKMQKAELRARALAAREG
jgi:acyl-CoA synthetase (AMP-forming)/AMP-acid ligase II